MRLPSGLGRWMQRLLHICAPPSSVAMNTDGTLSEFTLSIVHFHVLFPLLPVQAWIATLFGTHPLPNGNTGAQPLLALIRYLPVVSYKSSPILNLELTRIISLLSILPYLGRRPPLAHQTSS